MNRSARSHCAALALLLAAAHAGDSLAAPLAAPPEMAGMELEPYLTAEERLERVTRIRDAAAASGITNGVLIAGIAQAETGLAHCWSEATWACQGPPSTSCDGGPVIAGAFDGPCSSRQGGLGMFQFDSGTFDDTINTYGPDIVTIEGNVAAVVPFLTTRAIESVSGVNTHDEAIAWMNSIPVESGNQLFEDWLYFVAWRYNGCKGCTSKINLYRDGTEKVWNEFGAEFWAGGDLKGDCASVGSDGRTIEEDDACYRPGGSPQFWRTVESGHGGRLQWTKAVEDGEDNNYGVWNLYFDETGEFEVEIYTDGGEFGQSRSARYYVKAGESIAEREVDQSATDGWQSLGVFEFEANDDQAQFVRLGDVTGEPWEEDPGGVKLMFDAVRLRVPSSDVAPDTGDDAELEEDDGSGLVGGCESAGGSGTGPVGALLLFGWLLVFRRRPAQP